MSKFFWNFLILKFLKNIEIEKICLNFLNTKIFEKIEKYNVIKIFYFSILI